jgi:hypothetical protein
MGVIDWREKERGKTRMVSEKIQMKTIENTTNMQVTFSKCINGLLKKYYELSVIYDEEVGLVIFSK